MSYVVRFIELYKQRPLHAVGIGALILCPVGILIGIAAGLYEDTWQRERRERELIIEALMDGGDVMDAKRASLLSEVDRLRREIERQEAAAAAPSPASGDREACD